MSKIPGGLNQSAATEQLELSVSQLFPEAESAYVDLMLIHFPATWGGVGGKAMRQEEWRAMEAFAKAGKARAIGISHYCKRHLNDILEIATIKPAVNQVQVPYCAPHAQPVHTPRGLPVARPRALPLSSPEPSSIAPCALPRSTTSVWASQAPTPPTTRRTWPRWA